MLTYSLICVIDVYCKNILRHTTEQIIQNMKPKCNFEQDLKLYILQNEDFTAKQTKAFCHIGAPWNQFKIKKDGKVQELIQSSTTPDPGYHKGK